MNMRVFERADYAIYRSEDDLASPVERRDGSVVFECIAARAGILAYPSDSGGPTKYERVTVDTLKSMVPSMQFAYVTKGHPTDSNGRLLDVTPENVRELSYGQCGGEGDVKVVEEEDGEAYLWVRFVVWDKEMIEDIRSKKTANVSPRYQSVDDGTPGVDLNFGRYDSTQVTRDVNALAVCERGRGDRVVIRADSLEGDENMEMEALTAELAEKVAEKVMAMLKGGGLGADSKKYDSEDKEPKADTPPEEEPKADTPPEEEEPKADTPPEEEEPKADTPPEEEPKADTPPEEEEKSDEEMITIPLSEYERLKGERADGRPGFSEPEEKGDSAFDKNAWFEERSQLVEKAKSLGLDYSNQSTNAQIAGAICQRTLSGTSVLERADSDASFAIGAALGATVPASAASSGRYIVKPTGKAVVDSSAVVMPVSWHDIKTKS